MASLERREWVSHLALGGGLAKADLRSGPYEVYIPDHVAQRRFVFDAGVVMSIVEADAALRRSSRRSEGGVNIEAVARILLRAESSASSRIEGLVVGARRLLRASLNRAEGGSSGDVTADEVLANIDAMAFAVASAAPRQPITLQQILETHRLLLERSSLASHAGRLRTEQNWIGGSGYNPCSADFVPPPPEIVEPLMHDLVQFCNSDDLPAVAQAALAHGQFETIHPFSDGNGRTGRALIHMVLRRRDVVGDVLPPLSLVLATWGRDYINALQGMHYIGSADSESALRGANAWVDLFSRACARAAADIDHFETRMAQVRAAWNQRLGAVRADSAVFAIMDELPGMPMLTVQSAAEKVGRSIPVVNGAIARLVDAGIVRPINTKRRNRAFECPDVIDAFTALERQLASPLGNTSIREPERPVPYRPASWPKIAADVILHSTREDVTVNGVFDGAMERETGERIIDGTGTKVEATATEAPEAHPPILDSEDAFDL